MAGRSTRRPGSVSRGLVEITWNLAKESTRWWFEEACEIEQAQYGDGPLVIGLARADIHPIRRLCHSLCASPLKRIPANPPLYLALGARYAQAHDRNSCSHWSGLLVSVPCFCYAYRYSKHQQRGLCHP